MKRMCDPPDGWRYGFPKAIPDGVDLKNWLIKEGYPEDKVDKTVLKYCRFWNVKEEDLHAIAPVEKEKS